MHSTFLESGPNLLVYWIEAVFVTSRIKKDEIANLNFELLQQVFDLVKSFNQAYNALRILVEIYTDSEDKGIRRLLEDRQIEDEKSS